MATVNCQQLCDAVFTGDTERVRYFLCDTPAADRCKLLKLPDQGTVVHLAVLRGHTDILQCIADLIPEDDLYTLLLVEDQWGTTALRYAAFTGHTDTLKCMEGSLQADNWYKLLLIQNKRRSSAIHLATITGHIETVKYIIDSIPAIDRCKLLQAQDQEGYTAVHVAALKEHTKAMKFMVDSLPSNDRYKLLMVQDWEDNTAMHYGILRNHTETLKLIMDCLQPADRSQILNVINKNGQTALDQAIEHSKAESSCSSLQYQYMRLVGTSPSDTDIPGERTKSLVEEREDNSFTNTDELRHEIEKLANVVQEMQTQLSQFGEDNSALKRELSAAKRKNESLKDEYDIKIQKLETQALMSSQELDSKCQMLDTSTSTLETELSAATRGIQNVEAKQLKQADKQRTDHVDVNYKIGATNKSCQALKKVVRRHGTQIPKLKNQHKKLETRCQKLEAKFIKQPEDQVPVEYLAVECLAVAQEDRTPHTQ